MTSKSELKLVIEDMVRQYAHYHTGAYHTGGLSALEAAFDVLGWDDPHGDASAACIAPGCGELATCGTPTPDGGYDRLCGPHFRAAEAIVHRGHTPPYTNLPKDTWRP